MRDCGKGSSLQYRLNIEQYVHRETALRVKTDQWRYFNQVEKDSYVTTDSREHGVGT